MKVAWPYMRVSTADQSTDQQRLIIQRYFAYALEPAGYTLAATWLADEDVSGSLPLRSRPQGRDLMTCPDSGDAIVIAKLDRGFRDTQDCLATVRDWQRRGIAVHILDLPVTDLSTPEGELVLTLMAAIATWERRRIGQRMKDLWASRKARGLPCTTAPWGYRIVKVKGERVFARDDNARAIGGRIVEWRDAGWTLEQIYWHLFREGFRHTNGGGKTPRPLSPMSINRYERRERELRALEAQRRKDNPHAEANQPTLGPRPDDVAREEVREDLCDGGRNGAPDGGGGS